MLPGDSGLDSSQGTDGGGVDGGGADGSNTGADAGKDAGSLPDAIAPPSAWTNVTGNLAMLAAGGGDISIVSAAPDSGRVIAGVGQKGLFATDDSGGTWVALGTGAGSAAINNGPTAITYDPDHAGTFWESGIYGGGGFKTTDNGQTFSALGNLNHSDLLSVDFTDPARATILAGPHETKQMLWLSKDGGGTWKDIGPNLPADSNFSTLPLVIDTQTFLVGSCGWGQGSCGIFRSSNGGAAWTAATSDGPIARPLVAKSGVIYWSAYSDQGILVSKDNGQSFTKYPGPVSLYYSTSPVELPDGRIVTLGKTNLLASSDDGQTWKPIGDPLPFPGANCGIYGLTYSVWTKTFFVNHNDCSGHVEASSVWKAGFDYTKQ
jgi:hypothetical protein